MVTLFAVIVKFADVPPLTTDSPPPRRLRASWPALAPLSVRLRPIATFSL
ncbi:hypothetical protein AB0M20_15100 [Actinoplanes sp. NPDC051633]